MCLHDHEGLSGTNLVKQSVRWMVPANHSCSWFQASNELIIRDHHPKCRKTIDIFKLELTKQNIKTISLCLLHTIFQCLHRQPNLDLQSTTNH